LIAASSVLKREQLLAHNFVVGGGTIGAGLLGFVFQSTASHRLAAPEYGDTFAILTLVALLGFPAAAIALLVARQTSQSRAAGNLTLSASLLQATNRISLIVGLVLTSVLWVMSPRIAQLVGIPSELLIVGVAGLPSALALPVLLGELQGSQRFADYSLLSISQAALKVIAALTLSSWFGALGVVAGVTLASTAVYFVALARLRSRLTVSVKAFDWTTIADNLFILVPSTVALGVLLSADVLIVKLTFPKEIAGQFAAIAAVGRAIFWGASGVSAVLFPKIVFRQAQRQSGYGLVAVSLLLVAAGGLGSMIILLPLSAPILTTFAGPQYVALAGLLPLYAVGMTLLGGISVLVATHQSRAHHAFLAILLPLAVIEPLLLFAFHASLVGVIVVVDASMASGFVALAIIYVTQEARDGTAGAASVYVANEQFKWTVEASPSGLEGAFKGRALRILILSWRCPSNPRAGGAEAYTFQLARRLVAAGHSVEWFCASFPNALEHEVLDGIRIVRAGGPWSVYIHAFWRYRRALRDRFDAVIDEVNAVPFFTPLWAEIPSYMLIFQVERDVWWYQAPFPINAIGYAAEPLYMRGYRKTPTFTISASTQADLREMGHTGPITLIPVGAVDTVSSGRGKRDTPTFAYVGRLVPSKRVEHILEAIAHYRGATGTGELWLIGSGRENYRKSLERMAERRGIREHVTFWGRLTEEEKNTRVAESHALLMTSIREGWGLVVTEANVCGTPAIVYDVPGLRDAVQHDSTGLVVPPNPLSLCYGMLRLTIDRELYARLSDAARQWSQTLSYERAAKVVASRLQLWPSYSKERESGVSAAVHDPPYAADRTV